MVLRVHGYMFRLRAGDRPIGRLRSISTAAEVKSAETDGQRWRSGKRSACRSDCHGASPSLDLCSARGESNSECRRDVPTRVRDQTCAAAALLVSYLLPRRASEIFAGFHGCVPRRSTGSGWLPKLSLFRCGMMAAAPRLRTHRIT